MFLFKVHFHLRSMKVFPERNFHALVTFRSLDKLIKNMTVAPHIVIFHLATIVIFHLGTQVSILFLSEC